MPDKGKGKCPSCGRQIGLTPRGAVRRHNDPGGVVCAGGTPKRRGTPAAGRDASRRAIQERDASNVVPITGRPPRPRRAARQSAGETEAANETRPPSKALDRQGFGACGAKVRGKDGAPTGEACTQARGWGTDHVGFGQCKRHGGSTTNGKRYAALERARGELARVKGAMTFYGHRVVVDPEQALLEEMQRTAGAVRWLERALGEWGEFERLTAEMDDLDPDADDVAARRILDRITARITDHEHGDGARVRVSHADDLTGLPSLVAVHTTEKAVGFTDTEYGAWLKVYRDERRHLAAVAKACIDADIAVRRQTVLEARAEMIRSLCLAAFKIAGVDLDPPRALEVIAQATRNVARDLA